MRGAASGIRMATAKVSVTKVIVYGEGNGTVITTPSKQNPSGAWNLTAKQMRRLADSAGISVQNLRICKGTLVVVGENVKAGEEWSQTDRATGLISTGKYKVDHFRVTDLSIELTERDKMNLLIANSVAESLMVPAVREQVQIEHNDGGDDNDGSDGEDDEHVLTPEEIKAIEDAKIVQDANVGAGA